MERLAKGVSVMANAKKCDICGKFYEHYGREISPCNLEADTISPNSIDIGFSALDYPFNEFDRPVMYVRDHLDLCPECLGKILEFIESLKGDKE